MKELFIGRRIRLSAPRETDNETMLSWYEDSTFLRNVDTDLAKPQTLSEIKSFAESATSDKNNVLFYIRDLETDSLLGFIALSGIEWNNGCAMLAIGIGEAKNRNKGYGTEAIQLLLNYAFNELNLHRVGLNYISFNDAGKHLYGKSGFSHEGTVREYVHRDGKYYDLVYMGVLRTEWEALQGKNAL